jgi:hypothetical protein
MTPTDDFRFLKRADIKPENQSSGSSRKILIDDSGSHEFMRIVRLEIARNGSDGGYYLFHVSANGRGTDTWHETLEGAQYEAEADYGVNRSDWLDIL